jgi:hypothetical protein
LNAVLAQLREKYGLEFGHRETVEWYNAVLELAQELERDAEHWKRMYEFAQTANAYRQKALDD